MISYNYLHECHLLRKKLKVSTFDIRIKQSGLKVFHSKVHSSDLVIIDRIEEKMDIFELTVPFETNIKNANT